jgi:membrane complex biogenesis BtpA family protein
MQVYSLPKIIGVIHLPPLPGSPNFSGSFDLVLAHALQDCAAYHDGKIEGVIIENFGDAPFFVDNVPPITVASMTLIASELKRKYPDMHFGINVLRNDSKSSLSIATVVGAEFIRVNVHIGAVVADQGMIQGKSHETLRLRKNLDSKVKIFADIDVKHAVSVGNYDLLMQAADALERGLADAIIISGKRTGMEVDMVQLRRLRKEFPTAKIIVGSGANSKNVRQLLRVADSVIVGTSLKVNGITSNPVDRERLKDFVRAFHG